MQALARCRLVANQNIGFATAYDAIGHFDAKMVTDQSERYIIAIDRHRRDVEGHLIEDEIAFLKLCHRVPRSAANAARFEPEVQIQMQVQNVVVSVWDICVRLIWDQQRRGQDRLDREQ